MIHLKEKSLSVQISEWIGLARYEFRYFRQGRAKTKSHAKICLMFATNETAVKTVDWTRRIGSEKGEKSSIRWEGDGVSPLNAKEDPMNGLSPEWS